MSGASNDRWRCLATGCNPRLTEATAQEHKSETGHRVARWPVRSAEGQRRARFEAFVAELRAHALEEAADDYQERADHETPADIDPDWLRARAGRLRRGEPTSGATVETPPQSDFVEEFGQEE